MTNENASDGYMSRASFMQIFKPSYREAALWSAFTLNASRPDGYLSLSEIRLAFIHLGVNFTKVEAYDL